MCMYLASSLPGSPSNWKRGKYRQLDVHSRTCAFARRARWGAVYCRSRLVHGAHGTISSAEQGLSPRGSLSARAEILLSLPRSDELQPPILTAMLCSIVSCSLSLFPHVSIFFRQKMSTSCDGRRTDTKSSVLRPPLSLLSFSPLDATGSFVVSFACRPPLYYEY